MVNPVCSSGCGSVATTSVTSVYNGLLQIFPVCSENCFASRTIASLQGRVEMMPLPQNPSFTHASARSSDPFEGQVPAAARPTADMAYQHTIQQIQTLQGAVDQLEDQILDNDVYFLALTGQITKELRSTMNDDQKALADGATVLRYNVPSEAEAAAAALHQDTVLSNERAKLQDQVQDAKLIASSQSNTAVIMSLFAAASLQYYTQLNKMLENNYAFTVNAR